jgi:ribosomal protein S18 acetylase RimI-like enzyme
MVSEPAVKLEIRPFRDTDEADVVSVWHRSGRAVYTFLPTWQTFALDVAQRVFRDVIRPCCAIWVGTSEERVVAFIALEGSYVDRLYVDPAEWRRGWGQRLLAHAKRISPRGLSLHTHQANARARALYEKQGFEAVKFGVSPPPDRVPDVEYRWRPAAPERQPPGEHARS